MYVCMYVCMYAKQLYFAMSSNNEEPINNPKTQNKYFGQKFKNPIFARIPKKCFFRKNQKNRTHNSATGLLFS